MSDRLLTGIGIRTKEAISSRRANALFSLDDSKADLARRGLGRVHVPSNGHGRAERWPSSSGCHDFGYLNVWAAWRSFQSAVVSIPCSHNDWIRKVLGHTPAWLRADPKVGATDPSGVLVNIEINAHAKDLPPGRYGPRVRLRI